MREREALVTHEPSQCEGRACTLHNPSDHHMVDWPIYFRLDLRPVLVERICAHAIGHPDPDSVDWIASQLEHLSTESLEELRGWLGVHGCDGCCRGEQRDAYLPVAGT